MLRRLLGLPGHYIILVLLFAILSACTDHGKVPEDANANPFDPNDATVSFSSDVHPILLSNCNFSGCHGSSATRHELEVSSYATITADTPTYGPHVVPGEADSSRLYIAVSSRFMELGQLLRMPRGGDSLSSEQQGLIKTWINEGALDN